MLQIKPTLTFWRAFLVATTIGAIFFVAACQDESTIEKDSIVSENQAEEYSMLVETFESKRPPLPGVKTEIKESVIIIEAGLAVYMISDFKNREAYISAADFARQLDGKKVSESTVLEGLKERGKLLVISNPNQSEENQVPSSSTSKEVIYEVVEDMPVPIGGMETFYKTISENLKYSEEALEQKIEGRVYVQFVVDEEGRITELKTLKGLGHGLDEAAEKAIEATSGQWKAGRQRGKAVPTRMVMPIIFKL